MTLEKPASKQQRARTLGFGLREESVYLTDDAVSSPPFLLFGWWIDVVSLCMMSGKSSWKLSPYIDGSEKIQ